MQDNLLNELKGKLSPLFSEDKRIGVVYLFGSSACGLVHKRSDIDLAILLNPKEKFNIDDLLELEVKITLVLKTDRFDLVVANSCSLILKFRIISTGRLIYNVDDDLRTEFEEKVMQDYYDFLYHLNEFNRNYFSALRQSYLTN